MEEITHAHNQRPIYEKGDRQIYDWNDPMEVFGKKHTLNYPDYHPVVFDIETSAELGQRPILAVIYDSLAKEIILLYSHGYQDYTISRNKVEEFATAFDQKRIIVDNLSQSNFERYVLNRIHDWNNKAKNRGDKARKSLVAHNAVFDIPMMGSPDDGLLDVSRIGDQYEMSVQYKNVKMVGHRAGQFGQIYQFLDSSVNYESMYIPVGDTMVTAQALWLPGKLENACETIGVDFDVSTSETHGNLTDEYVKYNLNDVWATYLLYQKLNERLSNMFGDLPVESVYSTASIGKYVLKDMGYRRVGYSTDAIDRIAPAYFGGRTDAEITGEIIEDLDYTDILSEYPTVSKLTNVWEFMKAKYVTIEQINPDELPEINDLRNPDEWQKIANYYVKIKPEGATLPIRTPHLDDTTKVVTSIVHSEKELQYHYMDILAAELIDGERNFEIKAAWKAKKHGKQQLSKTEIGGITIQPEHNVMGKSIESRKEIQANQGYKDEKTKSLKITANSLYGVTAERIVKEIDGEKHDIASKSGFYNPHVACTITAGGRLMIALGENRAKEYGSKLIYCDTDSLILESDISDKVIEDFSNLNPYDNAAGEFDVLEKEKSGNLYAVGTKKYIFFDNNGKPLEVKEHGLGNYENLRDNEIIKRLWATILYYDLGENPLNINILYDGKLNEPVLWSFNASTRSMRVMIDDLTQDYIRYGDWIQSTISYDNKIRYMALNLKEKSKSEKVAKVKMEGETPIQANPVTAKEMQNDERLKTVKDVVFKFTADSGTPDIRPTVNVNELKSVTKEATNRKDIFTANLEKQFSSNMIHLETVLPENQVNAD